MIQYDTIHVQYVYLLILKKYIIMNIKGYVCETLKKYYETKLT